MIKNKEAAIFLSVFLVLFLGPKVYGQDYEDNPFLNRSQELRYEDEPERMLGGMDLTAILYSGESSRAIIDGQIVEIGDAINNLEIVEIKSEKVVFEDYLGKEYVLKMKNVLTANGNESGRSEEGSYED